MLCIGPVTIVGLLLYPMHRKPFFFRNNHISCEFVLTNKTWHCCAFHHYSDVIVGTMASQITSLTIVYSTVNSGADQRKHQSSASLAFVRGIHR